MSAVEIVSQSSSEYPNTGRYWFFEARSGKHHATVMITHGGGALRTPPYVRVIVHNASNKCWRQLGRTFKGSGEAMAYYKTQAIRDIINAAHVAVAQEVLSGTA